MTAPKPTDHPELNPSLVRKARALLAWSRDDLATEAKVHSSTVTDLERGSRHISEDNARAIRSALTSNGIQFSSMGEVLGPVVPTLSPSVRHGTPVRWVNSDDLAAWASRADGPVNLPTLMTYLIRATHGSSAHLHFPSDGGVRHPGWDGLSNVETGSIYVPAGETGWELSAQREKVATKIKGDYSKRTEDPQPLIPNSSACVFVTLQHWPKKEKWAKAKKAEGPWRDVRVYDADDLVHWIEMTPAVGLWLAIHLGKRPPGTRELDAAWKEWSLATRWPLTEDLVLCDRDQSSAKVLRWLRAGPSVLSLQSTSSEEVVAFFHATLGELPEDAALAYRAHCLVVDAPAARALVNSPAPVILVLTEPEPGLAESLVANGHFVLQAYDQGVSSRGEVLTLERPSREGIALALQAAGIPVHRSKVLARDSARNLTVLRRLIPVAPGREPNWAQATPPRALLAALLAGGWDEDQEADRDCLAALAGAPYEQIVGELTPYVGQFDSPLQKIGSSWRIASPYDAWLVLARSLSRPDINRFEAAAHAVLGAVDARFEMPPQERWMAGVRGINCNYSELLRHGIGQVLILLALWGDQAHAVGDASRRADSIVANLLSGATQSRWWSLSRDFRLLAEASPVEFLSAVDDSLDQCEPPISVLFEDDSGDVFGAEHLSDLMWAMETLAWSPDLLPRVTSTLARLAAIDVKPRRYSNGPARSLREMHLLWNPQTYATLDERLQSLDLLRKRQGDMAWNLMLGILPSAHDSATPSPAPLWRDFSIDSVEVVTRELIKTGAISVSQRLLADVGTDAARWTSLIDRIRDVSLDPSVLLTAFEEAEPRITSETDRSLIWDKLRRVLHHNREFGSAPWALTSSVLDRLDLMYSRFAPKDLLQQVAWLFQNGAALPNPSAGDWAARDGELHGARVEAAKAIFGSGGAAAILSLAGLAEAAGTLGRAIYDARLPAADIESLIEASLQANEGRAHDLACGLIVSAFVDFKEAWGSALIKKVRARSWGEAAIVTTLLAFPPSRWIWDQTAEIGGGVERSYWSRTPTLWISGGTEEFAYAIRHLIDVGRARSALSMIRPQANIYVATELLIELLNAAVDQSSSGDSDSSDSTMFQYYVAEAFKSLDARDDVQHDAIVMLEWRYLQVLEHSSRPAKALLDALSEQPSLFIEMLKSICHPSEESGLRDQDADPERAGVSASQAYRLLDLWDRLPGTLEDGTIDYEVLEAWIREARSQAGAIGRRDAAEGRIGNMLSASPPGLDGNWPAEPVREVLDGFRSRSMLEGFRVGKYNRRGISTRMPGDGGEQERGLSAQFRNWAKAIAGHHPYTSKALEDLAKDYDQDALRHDEDAKRMDWE